MKTIFEYLKEGLIFGSIISLGIAILLLDLVGYIE